MKYLLLLFILSNPMQVYSNSLHNLLSNEQLKLLQENKIIVRESKNKFKKSPWPEVEVWTLIKAIPLESVGIYYALDYQKEYVPNVIKSNPIKQPTPLETHTEYEYEMVWPIPNGKYINGSKLAKLGSNSYQVNWWLIKNNTAYETNGTAIFSPYNGNTILYYKVYVHPKTIFARLLRSKMVDSVKVSIKAIKDHIELLKSQNSALLKKYSLKISGALQGDFTYRNK